MLLSDLTIRPVPVYEITAADMLKTIAAGYAIGLLLVGLGMLVFLPEYLQVRAARRQQAEMDAVESAETVELPRRSGPRSTGTVCGAGYRRETADDITTVIDTRQVCR